MKSGLSRFSAAAILVVLLLTMASDQAARVPAQNPGVPGAAAAASLVGNWPKKPRALARLMLEKYGGPDELVASQISWNRRGPWRKIVVFRDPDPSGRAEHLLRSVAYGALPLDRWPGLAAFGRGSSYDAAARELAARTDDEATNFLALNLADEVIRGRRSPGDARDFYDAASSLASYGKSSPYMSGLLFGPRQAAR